MLPTAPKVGLNSRKATKSSKKTGVPECERTHLKEQGEQAYWAGIWGYNEVLANGGIPCWIWVAADANGLVRIFL
ncbi:MAG: hypothetical protein OHK0012_21310 [Synechococcales cyanobacterium]